MATWQFDITGLEITGQDNNGWPLTRLVSLTMQVEESNTIRLYKTAKQLAREKFQDYAGIFINSFDRVDKRTGKDYGGYHDNLDELRCKLNSNQRAALEQLKEDVFAKVIGDSKSKDERTLLFSHDGWVKSWADDVACFQTQAGILRHGPAKEMIAALENFYSRITPEALEVLYMSEALSQDELKIVRSFNVTVAS